MIDGGILSLASLPALLKGLVDVVRGCMRARERYLTWPTRQLQFERHLFIFKQVLKSLCDEFKCHGHDFDERNISIIQYHIAMFCSPCLADMVRCMKDMCDRERHLLRPHRISGEWANRLEGTRASFEQSLNTLRGMFDHAILLSLHRQGNNAPPQWQPWSTTTWSAPRIQSHPHGQSQPEQYGSVYPRESSVGRQSHRRAHRAPDGSRGRSRRRHRSSDQLVMVRRRSRPGDVTIRRRR